MACINDSPPFAPMRDGPRPSARRARGFTIIELMVVMAVLAALVAIAWPAYRDAVTKSRRADAMAVAVALQQQQERARSSATEFPQSLASAPYNMADGATMESPDRHYRASLSGVAAGDCPAGISTDAGNSYRISIQPDAQGKQSGDTLCAVMTVASCRGTMKYASQNAGGAANDPDPCWVR